MDKRTDGHMKAEYLYRIFKKGITDEKMAVQRTDGQTNRRTYEKGQTDRLMSNLPTQSWTRVDPAFAKDSEMVLIASAMSANAFSAIAADVARAVAGLSTVVGQGTAGRMQIAFALFSGVLKKLLNYVQITSKK
jgi:hypothetical protein